MNRLSTDGVFLLENGIDLYLWVGRGADPDLVSALFGVASLEGQDLNLIQIQVIVTQASRFHTGSGTNEVDANTGEKLESRRHRYRF